MMPGSTLGHVVSVLDPTVRAIRMGRQELTGKGTIKQDLLFAAILPFHLVSDDADMG